MGSPFTRKCMHWQQIRNHINCVVNETSWIRVINEVCAKKHSLLITTQAPTGIWMCRTTSDVTIWYSFILICLTSILLLLNKIMFKMWEYKEFYSKTPYGYECNVTTWMETSGQRSLPIDIKRSDITKYQK